MPRTPYRRHIDDVGSFAIRLRRTRERQGLSQRGLAFPGCTSAYISRIEGGERVPSLHIIKELSTRLGVDADWLATGSSADGGEATEELRRALAAFKRTDDGGRSRQEALEWLIKSVERIL